MNLRYVNRTDLIVTGASALILTAFLINTRLDSAIPLYISSLIVLGIFTYWAIRKDTVGMLRRSLIIAGIGELFYTWVDTIFFEQGIITYSIGDVEILSTPLSIALVGVCCIAIAIYFYQRLRSIFGRAYIPAILTGVSAFLAGVALNHLGAELWRWSSVWLDYREPGSAPLVTTMPCIGSVPLFVPIALFITFSLSPYIIGGQRFSRRIGISNNVIAAGLRCAVLLPMMIYLSFMIFSRLGGMGLGR